jgi:type VI secretion system ImpM family protein
VFGRPKKALKPTVFALGKIAGHPEFLTAPDALAMSLDRWLDVGWQDAHRRYGEAWDAAFAEGATYGFIWGHGSKVAEVTCGVVVPSVDSIGRRYPFVVGSRMPAAKLGHGWSVLPLAAGGFLDDAHAVMAETQSSALSTTELAQRLSQLAGPSPDDVEGAEEAHTAWCAETSVETAWSAMFSDQPLEAASRALRLVVESLQPWIGHEWPSTELVLRLPMGDGGPAAAVVWFDVIRTVLRWRRTIPTAFWAAEGSSLLMGLGPPTPRTLAELWWPDPDADHVVDVVAAAEHEADAGDPVETPTAATMADLLTVLAAGK